MMENKFVGTILLEQQGASIDSFRNRRGGQPRPPRSKSLIFNPDAEGLIAPEKTFQFLAERPLSIRSFFHELSPVVLLRRFWTYGSRKFLFGFPFLNVRSRAFPNTPAR
jgi:hypothetical protein